MDLAISPCPNDTYIFHKFLQREFSGLELDLHLEDVEELNRRAIQEHRHAISKLSYFAIAALQNDYTLIKSGGALGRGCGPILLSGKECDESDLISRLKGGARILIPGRWTTANLLLHLYLQGLGLDPRELRIEPSRYDNIMKALQKGESEFGVIIHEERFTFPRYDLKQVRDMGDWWETETGFPIPLGGIMVRNDVPTGTRLLIEERIGESILYARQHPEESRDFIKKHAQSLEDHVIDSHIGLYVNDFSVSMGESGEAAIQELFRRAAPFLGK